jgi:hypothetical protein
LEGPTADNCEKGGRNMALHPLLPIRLFSKEVQQFLHSSESLVTARLVHPQSFSEEELRIVAYYVAEVNTVFALPTKV